MPCYLHHGRAERFALVALFVFLFFAAVADPGSRLLHAADPPATEEAAPPLRTALTGRFPPFSFYGSDGELTGFDVDVSREIARRIGRESEITATEWDGILAGLLTGHYDAIIGSMAITPERQEQVHFSTPYYHSGAQLFVHRENPRSIYSIDEAAGARIGVVLGETYQHHLENHHPEIDVVTFRSSTEIFEMLDRHRIDGFLTDRLVGSWQIQQAGRNFVPVGPMLYQEEIAIPVRLEDTELLGQINAALAAMRDDGTLRAIHRRYFHLGATDLADGTYALGSRVVAMKLLRGFAVTLGIAAGAILLGILLAIPCALLLSHKRGILLLPHFIARTLVDFLRGTPVLIQLLFAWIGLGLPPIHAGVLTLGVNAMAYMAEVFRAGLMSVDPGQARAARALGLTAAQRFRHVVWPQAFRISIPPLMNSIVALIKDTALVAVISIPEVIREAQSIISINFQPQKYYLVVAVMFFAVTFPLMKLSSALERRIKQKGFVHD